MSEAVYSVFSQYATFRGRARRSEFWYYCLFNFLVSLVLSIVTTILPQLVFLPTLYALAVFVPGLALSWRRLHDIGKSGTFVFLCLIPLLGAILLIVWFCRDSQPGANQYGPNPKDPHSQY